ncbi:MAG: DUF58 domain-containing protein [Oligoflexales bacterium]|nr:DUF58 domain-containing protein [Oligoflexales bacterium]
MLSPELIRQIKNIQLKAGHLVTEAMAGEYLAAFKGVGMEFEKVREYTHGDDVRSIDWNVTARMNEPFVKVFREERDMTLMLMVDVSPSQHFGSQGRFKHEKSAELIAVLAFLAIKNNDKVGLIIFSDHIERLIPPKKGRAHVWSLIREVLLHRSSGRSTRINLALDTLMQVLKRRSLCFLVSDFKSENFEKSLSQASKRHELVCVKVSDVREETIPACGMVEMEDSETGETLLVDTHDHLWRNVYEGHARQEERFLNSLFDKHRVGYFSVQTEGEIVMPLYKFLRRRERKGIR